MGCHPAKPKKKSITMVEAIAKIEQNMTPKLNHIDSNIPEPFKFGRFSRLKGSKQIQTILGMSEDPANSLIKKDSDLNLNKPTEKDGQISINITLDYIKAEQIFPIFVEESAVLGIKIEKNIVSDSDPSPEASLAFRLMGEEPFDPEQESKHESSVSSFLTIILKHGQKDTLSGIIAVELTGCSLKNIRNSFPKLFLPSAVASYDQVEMFARINELVTQPEEFCFKHSLEGQARRDVLEREKRNKIEYLEDSEDLMKLIVNSKSQGEPVQVNSEDTGLVLFEAKLAEEAVSAYQQLNWLASKKSFLDLIFDKHVENMSYVIAETQDENQEIIFVFSKIE